MKKLLIGSLIAASALFGQTINLSSGWNNVGIAHDNVNIREFNESGIEYIWHYNNNTKNWEFYTFNNELLEAVNRDIDAGRLNISILRTLLNTGDSLWIYTNHNTQVNIIDATGIFTAKGVVKDFTTNEEISDYIIRIYEGNTTQDYEINGSEFSLDLPMGEYIFEIHKDGYQDLNISVVPETIGTLNLGQIYLTPENIAGTSVEVTGRVLDATTGNPINGVRMEFIPGYNNPNGEPVASLVSSDGLYDINLTSGAYTVKIQAEGYYPTTYNYTFASADGTISQDFALAPQQATNEEVLRAVLTWGELPRDLDSHFIMEDSENNNTVLWHIYYAKQYVYEYNGTLYNEDYINHDPNITKIAQLDVDDTSSYGPETVTLEDLNTSAVYKYFVYNYSGSPDLKDSNAHVIVYYNGREYEFQVPNEEGRLWKVFEIRNGVLYPCVENCMFNTSYGNNNLATLRIQNQSIDEESSIRTLLNDLYNHSK